MPINATARTPGCASSRNESINRVRQASGKTLAQLVLMAAALFTLSACSSSGGGDEAPEGSPAGPNSLVFTYPFNGQQDVVRGTQIVAKFGTPVTNVPESGADDGGFNMVVLDAEGNPVRNVRIDVEQDDDQPNIYRIDAVDGGGDPVKLAAETTYLVKLNDRRLFRFTTRPVQGRPAGDEPFKVLVRTPGGENAANPVTGVTLPFTEFNSIRLRLSAPVDPTTVKKGKTFFFTDASGTPIPGRLTALGRYITFDPFEDLDSTKTYTLRLTEDVQSAFGASLVPFTDTLTPLDTGNETKQSLLVKPTGPLKSLPDNPLNGRTTNVAVIQSQLIGKNKQVASNPALGGLTTVLAEGGMPGFGTALPAVIRAGQRVQLSKLSLELSGVVDTPITSGPIKAVFINDVNVYLLANQLRAGKTPTAVRLRFDVAISTKITAPRGSKGNVIQSLANGLFNQTVLNIQAAGIATPAPDGDLVINAVASFPIKVNRIGNAVIDLELRLILPAVSQPDIGRDTSNPVVTAQFPSACLYLFGTDAYGANVPNFPLPATPIVPEGKCVTALESQTDKNKPFINNFRIEASPFVLFSEPLAPATVSSKSVTLINRKTGDDVPTDVRVEGTTVVVDPVELLKPDTTYAIRVNEGLLTDLAGNNVITRRRLQPIVFKTEALVDAPDAPPVIGSIMPGLPCALEGGNFQTGGDVAGHCVGDNPPDGSSISYPVFNFPANQTVDIFLSSFVKTDSIVLANGCLVGGGNAATKGTFAVQHMDGNGNCLGVVEGKLVPTNLGAAKTRGFTFRPANGFKVGERYWIVICGTDGQCSTGAQIEGVAGSPINTNPLQNASNAGFYGAGGPTLIMPFDAVEPVEDFYATLRTVPYTDTNGNGKVDKGERKQPSNKVAVHILGLSFQSYLSLSRPVAIRDDTTKCAPVADVTLPSGKPVVGTVPERCIPVTLLPGGLTLLTEIMVLGQSTGPIILRYPYVDGEDADSIPEKPQTGYIVESCTGKFQGESYHYAPCFVADLTLTVNAPDAASLLDLGQQQINVEVFGPVTFEQNGRLVISLVNANKFTLDALAPAVTNPGELHFQLAGVPSHGGRGFPLR